MNVLKPITILICGVACFGPTTSAFADPTGTMAKAVGERLQRIMSESSLTSATPSRGESDLGACCIDGACAMNSEESACHSAGGEWFAGEDCYAIPPFRCPVPTGACCVWEENTNRCVATNTNLECEALGGQWYRGDDCFAEVPFVCPITPADYLIIAPYVSPARSLLAAGDDCSPPSHPAGQVEHTYEVALGACCLGSECVATNTEAECLALDTGAIWHEAEDCEGQPPFMCSPGCPEDLTGDGQVGLEDLAALLSIYMDADAVPQIEGDIDGNGHVDLADLACLLAAYGRNCPTN